MRSTASKDCNVFTSAFSCAITEVTPRHLWSEGRGCVHWKDIVCEDQLVMFVEILGLAMLLFYVIVSKIIE